MRCLRPCRGILRGPEDGSIPGKPEKAQVVRNTVCHDACPILTPLFHSRVGSGRISEYLVEALRTFHLEYVREEDVIREVAPHGLVVDNDGDTERL